MFVSSGGFTSEARHPRNTQVHIELIDLERLIVFGKISTAKWMASRKRVCVYDQYISMIPYCEAINGMA